MKVVGELVVDRTWKPGKRRNLLIEWRLRGPPTALNRQWNNATTRNNCYIIGMGSLLPCGWPANRSEVIT